MKKHKKIKLLLLILTVIIIFYVFYLVINDNKKENIILSNISNFMANIFNITSFSNNNYHSDLISEINKDYKKEINDLKNELKLNDINSDKTFINASICVRSSEYWYNQITINKGRKDGIKKGFAVINSDGLVGKIISVRNNTSVVKLLTALNKDTYISASFEYENNTYYGLISEYDYKKNQIILKNVIGDFDESKINNINVVTSSLSNKFKSGLLIGKIKKVEKDTFGISNNFTIEPTVNFNNINIVSVVGDEK